jgi:hypothetical protein
VQVPDAGTDVPVAEGETGGTAVTVTVGVGVAGDDGVVHPATRSAAMQMKTRTVMEYLIQNRWCRR